MTCCYDMLLWHVVMTCCYDMLLWNDEYMLLWNDEYMLLWQVSKDYIITTVTRWQANTWQENEAALNLLYHLAEALPVQHGSYFTSPFEVSSYYHLAEALPVQHGSYFTSPFEVSSYYHLAEALPVQHGSYFTSPFEVSSYFCFSGFSCFLVNMHCHVSSRLELQFDSIYIWFV